MLFKTILESIILLIVIVLLIVGFCYEDKVIQFEQDILAIYRACKRQNISLRQLLRMLNQDRRNNAKLKTNKN